MDPTTAFWCAKCGYRSDVPERLVGHKVKCPKCETRQILRKRGANTLLTPGQRSGEHPVPSGQLEDFDAEPAATTATADLGPPPAPPSRPAPSSGDTFGDKTLSASEATSAAMNTPPTISHPVSTRRHTTRTLRPSAPRVEEPRPSAKDDTSLGLGDRGFAKPQLPPDEQSLSLTSMSVAGTSLATIKPATTMYTRDRANLGVGYSAGVVIGRGGMGEVHACEQRALGRIVAIKSLTDGVGDEPTAMRFRAEAVVMAMLEHPNIIPVHDLVREADGTLRLVMKRIAGVTWRDLLYPATEDQVRRSVQTKFDDHLDILLKTCDAIAFAHDRGILHLDLKPANVMVGAFGEVLVLDWGCALSYRSDAPPLVPTTEEFGGLSGTPAYMSPEMANQSGALGVHSDIYLLGAILYELLAGRPPHRADTIPASLTAAMLNQAPQPRPRDNRPSPPELVALAAAAMDTDPTKRPISVAEFARRLRDYRRQVEANRLLAQARSELERAAKDSENADDHFRRAQAACEQAAGEWQDSGEARPLLARILTEHAQHALATGAYRVARSQAGAAAALAGKMQDRKLAAAAQGIHEAAESDERANANRRRTARLLVAGLVLVLTAGVVAVTMTLSSLSSQRQSAKEEVQAAKADATEEGEAGSERERTRERGELLPIVLNQVRREISTMHLEQALADIAAARHLSAGDAVAADLEGAIHAAQHHWREAAESLARAKPASHETAALAAVVASAISGWNPAVDARLRSVLLDQGLTPLVGLHQDSPDELEAYWRRACERFCPGSAGAMRVVDGKIDYAPSAAALASVRDLAPLAGLPIRTLVLDGSRIDDLAPLAGMPLERLSLKHALVRDLTPLAGMALVELDCSDTYVVDLAPLARVPLTRLVLAGTPVVHLDALTQPSLADLDCSRTRASIATLHAPNLRTLRLAGVADIDLDAVAALPIQALSLRDCSLDHLDALAHLRLRALDIAGTPVASLAPLARMPLSELELAGCTAVTDLAPLANAPLERLDISKCGATDVRPIAHAPLRELMLTPDDVTTGMDQLRAVATLARIGQEAAADFWRRYDRR